MIKVGIIGVGAIAQLGHIPSYQKIDGVRIVALSDSNREKAEAVARKSNIETYFTDYKDLLELNEIEAVSICTPNFFHQEQVIASLRAGKNVLCEKPLCLNAREAEEIFKETEKTNNKICMIAYMRRFMSISQILKEFIDQRELGEIYYAKASYLRRRGIPTAGSWFTSKEMSGGGSLIDIGVHILDLSLWLMGNPTPLSAVGSTYAKFRNEAVSAGWPPANTLKGDKFNYNFDVEDLTSSFVKFNNGATLFLETSWAGNSETEGTLSLFGTKGGAKISFCEGDPLYGRLKIFKGRQGRLYDITPVLSLKEDAFHKEVEHFIDCIKQRKNPITTPAEALNVARIIDAIYQSAEEGKEIKINSLPN